MRCVAFVRPAVRAVAVDDERPRAVRAGGRVADRRPGVAVRRVPDPGVEPSVRRARKGRAGLRGAGGIDERLPREPDAVGRLAGPWCGEHEGRHQQADQYRASEAPCVAHGLPPLLEWPIMTHERRSTAVSPRGFVGTPDRNGSGANGVCCWCIPWADLSFMVRTQIYLTEQQRTELAAIAAHRGQRQSEVIREAVDRFIERNSHHRREAILRRAAGLWRDRADVPDLDALRRGWDRN